MAGLSYAHLLVDGQYKRVDYGDLVECDITTKRVLARFIEVSDDGDAWFEEVSPDGSTCGNDVFSSDHWYFVGVTKVIGKETPEMFCGEHI